jgi:hypothetical protein
LHLIGFSVDSAHRIVVLFFQRAVSIFGLGLIVLINWSAIYALFSSIPNGVDRLMSINDHPYDWKFGVFQYSAGFLISYVGLVAIEGATLSLLSKVSSAASRNPLLNVGTILTFLTLFARALADIQIVTVGVSHHIINIDMVNSLVVPLLMVCVIAGILIRRHFFFLM